mmetsp:Transcript_19697/g.58588  ORF Transcript_19697/g.58588 Transcript_19697/m.58588 type:complete len:245 (+) Transcript_19697:833-1567(+)
MLAHEPLQNNFPAVWSPAGPDLLRRAVREPPQVLDVAALDRPLGWRLVAARERRCETPESHHSFALVELPVVVRPETPRRVAHLTAPRRRRRRQRLMKSVRPPFFAVRPTLEARLDPINGRTRPVLRDRSQTQRRACLFLPQLDVVREDVLGLGREGLPVRAVAVLALAPVDAVADADAARLLRVALVQVLRPDLALIVQAVVVVGARPTFPRFLRRRFTVEPIDVSPEVLEGFSEYGCTRVHY